MPLPLLSPETEQRLRDYAALLATWTRRINLVSQADAAHIWSRHVEDSLRLASLIPPGTTRGIDLGSGAGLPGLVLAIATGIHFDLIESDHRKSAFLLEAARITGAVVTVHTTRIEQAPIAPAPLITARALAPLDKLLALATPHLAPGGTMLFPKGARAPDEIGVARETWRFGLTIVGVTNPVLVVTEPSPMAAAAPGQVAAALVTHA